jgi:NAD(P)-dependent dehydrogenase (short-subunit alcohol dehydrogenase family)
VSTSEKPVAVVAGVGASRGVGAAVARRFAAGGFHLVLAGRTKERVDSVAQEIADQGGAAEALQTDVTVEADVDRLMACADGLGAGLRAAIYNVGNNRRGRIADLDMAVFEQAWRENAFGGAMFARAAARHMLPRGEGTMIFTGATASVRSRPPFAPFAAAKAALRSVAMGAAREFGPSGIHVAHVVIDGGIDGEQLRSRYPDRVAEMGPDGLLNPDQIADAYWALHAQGRSAWTFELDVRPFGENW